MAVDDPTALPEDAQQTAEYIREADLAFDREQHELALSLYWSASSAGLFAGDDSRKHANLRVGTILMGQGNDDEPYRWLEAVGPAGADLLRVIDAKTTDAAADPDVVPDTPEVLTRYMNAVVAANATNDHATFDQHVARIMDSTATLPAQRSRVCLLMVQSLLDRGFARQAEEWAQAALAESSGSSADEGLGGFIDERFPRTSPCGVGSPRHDRLPLLARSPSAEVTQAATPVGSTLVLVMLTAPRSARGSR